MRKQIKFKNYTILYEVESRIITFEVALDRALVLKGSIKWNECSNWDFCTDDSMMHFCDREEIKAFGELLCKLYDIAEEKLPTYGREPER